MVIMILMMICNFTSNVTSIVTLKQLASLHCYLWQLVMSYIGAGNQWNGQYQNAGSQSISISPTLRAVRELFQNLISQIILSLYRHYKLEFVFRIYARGVPFKIVIFNYVFVGNTDEKILPKSTSITFTRLVAQYMLKLFI